MSFVCGILCYLFFFKQKTAYEMRISDWSSDVCSSDLKKISFSPPCSARQRAIRRSSVRRIASGTASSPNSSWSVSKTVTAMIPSIWSNSSIRGQNGSSGSARVRQWRSFFFWDGSCGSFSIRRALRSLRSEEHTSELQSLMRISYAVFCLKNKKYSETHQMHNKRRKTIKSNKRMLNTTEKH